MFVDAVVAVAFWFKFLQLIIIVLVFAGVITGSRPAAVAGPSLDVRMGRGRAII